MRRAPIHSITSNLFLIDLDLPLPGFRRFISSWVLTAGDRAMVIDPGPSATIAALCEALRELGVQGIDDILLTHIHLDHAGRCGDLMRQYPEPTLVCHPQAVNHLASSARLWQGSLKGSRRHCKDVRGVLTRNQGEGMLGMPYSVGG